MTDLEPNGLLVLDKPAGPTSHDCVGRARRWFGTRKVGHAGTLDPFATGVLVLAIGRSTRLLEYVSGCAKAYRGTVLLGRATSTDDVEGETVSEADTSQLSAQDVIVALVDLTGEIQQVPPMASAKKVEGQRLHKLHRQGQVVEREAATVRVDRLELVDFQAGAQATAQIEVECGPGTYIRALARDLGEALGVGGHLTELQRTRVGDWSIDEALTWEALEAMPVEERLAALSPPSRAVKHLPRTVVPESDRQDLICGKLVVAEMADADPVAAFDEAGELMAIGEVAEGWLKPRKVFCVPLNAEVGDRSDGSD